jgi:Xaa-Pro aminopeptidase
LDGVLVTALVNIRYLTGFTGSNAALLVAADGATVLATDGRYATQAAQQAPGVEVLVTRSLGPDLVALAERQGLRRLGIERRHVSLTSYDALLATAGESVELVDAGEPVEALRLHKDATELEAISAACRVTDETFAAVLTALRPGVTEIETSWALRCELHARGSEPAFESIVAFGPNSAIPHHRPSGRELAHGDLVKLDFGAMFDGYASDMTRTVVVGEAAQWQRDLHALVRQIQQECREAVVPGAVPVELDAMARQRIEAAGHDVAHGLGHGVGLEIHESPFLVPGSPADRLVDGVPVTVEPGVYLPGRGGVRIEDTVLVRAGGADSLTHSSRELIEI